MSVPTIIERITKTPGVCGGRACIRGHRIPVWGIVAFRRLGATNARILAAYPPLAQEDLDAAGEYAAGHPDVIDRDIRENEEGYPSAAE